MAFQAYREESKKNWGTSEDGGLTDDQIRTGAILRIADALEVMAENHDKLVRDRDWLRERLKEEEWRGKTMRRANAALRGHVSRLKKKAGQSS